VKKGWKSAQDQTKALEKVENRFRLEFEFESFSNSNYTQIKSK
jgi:hypothetical protein